MSAAMPPTIAYCLWDGRSCGLGRVWGGSSQSAMDWAVKHHIKFIANFSHMDLDHAEGIPHVWVNIGYKGQDKMPYGPWEKRVKAAFRTMVETLYRGDDVLGHCMRSKHRTSASLASFLALIQPGPRDYLEKADLVLQEILRIHPSVLTPRDEEKINSVWDQSDIRAFSIRLQTEPSLFQCPVLDEVHKKIWNTVGGEIGWQGIKVRDQVLKPRGSVATDNLHMQVSSKETKVTKQKKETKHKKQMINYNPALAAATSKSKAKSEMMGPSKMMVQGLRKKFVAKVMAKSRPKKKPDNVAHVSGSSADDYYSESDGSEVDGLLQGPACVAAAASDRTTPKSAGRRSERPRSEDSSREQFRRQPPRGRSRERQRSASSLRGQSRSRSDHRCHERDQRRRSVSPRSSGAKSMLWRNRRAPAPTPPRRQQLRTPSPRHRSPKPPRSAPLLCMLGPRQPDEPPPDELWYRSWSCFKCNTHNKRFLLNCRHCLGHRAMCDPNMEIVARHHDWICEQCGNINFQHRKVCNWAACTSKDWTCTCGNVNFARRPVCNAYNCYRFRPW